MTVTLVRLPRRGEPRAGLVVLEVEPGSPAAMASLLPGDILLGTDYVEFFSADELATALQGSEAGLLRIRLLRGDYSKVRRVSASLPGKRGPIAA